MKSLRKKAAQDLVDLMDARKKSVSGSLDENPELKSKWEKVFFQRFLAMDLSMIDDNCFLLRIMTQKSGDSLNEAGLNVNGRQRGVLE